MTADEIIERARSALNHNVRYVLGYKYFDPLSPEPPTGTYKEGDIEYPRGLDCGTFVRWAAKLELPSSGGAQQNQQSTQVRWDTTGIVWDALGAQGYFSRLTAPQRGCLVVYPDYSWKPIEVSLSDYAPLADAASPAVNPEEPKTMHENMEKHDGHVGIVTRTVTKNGKEVVASVIHCSRLNEMYCAALKALKPDLPLTSILETNVLWFPAFAPIFVSINLPS